MALLEVNWNPSRRELKQFAIMWVVFFGLIGLYLHWGEESSRAAATLWAVATLGVAGYFLPSLLRPVYVVWMALALPIGWTISHLLLLSVFYLVVTPIGLLMRVVGYDPLTRQMERSAKTYWTPHDPSADVSRYFKQF